MIALRGNSKNRHTNIGKRNRLALNCKPAFGKIVIQEQAAQIFAMHLIRHARDIGIPGHQIIRRPAFPQHIILHSPRPDEITGAQHLEGSGHMLAAQIAFFPHGVFQPCELTLISEHRKLARFFKINLRGKQGQGF